MERKTKSGASVLTERKGPGGQQEAEIRRGVNLKGSGSRDH